VTLVEQNGVILATSLTTNYEYNLDGNLIEEDLPNGVVDQFTYDNMSQLTKETEDGPGNAPIAEYDSTYRQCGIRRNVRPLLVFLAVSAFVASSGCTQRSNDASDAQANRGPDAPASPLPHAAASRVSDARSQPAEVTPDEDHAAYQRAKDQAVAESKREYYQKLRNPSAKRISLPNFSPGAGLPPPIGINFYEEREWYPGYLLCLYDVSEAHYDPSNEPEWFEPALLQIRGYGRSRFPPSKWVAVIVRNRAEHKGVSTFEQSHKVGAIFELNDVFDRSCNLTDLVKRTPLDRHPLVYEPGSRLLGNKNAGLSWSDTQKKL
jgi:YD repeat-containing protein